MLQFVLPAHHGKYFKAFTPTRHPYGARMWGAPEALKENRPVPHNHRPHPCTAILAGQGSQACWWRCNRTTCGKEKLHPNPEMVGNVECSRSTSSLWSLSLRLGGFRHHEPKWLHFQISHNTFCLSINKQVIPKVPVGGKPGLACLMCEKLVWGYFTAVLPKALILQCHPPIKVLEVATCRINMAGTPTYTLHVGHSLKPTFSSHNLPPPEHLKTMRK